MLTGTASLAGPRAVDRLWIAVGADRMALLGVLARVQESEYDAMFARLEQVDGVTPFGIGETMRVGILVEAESLSLSHALLTQQIETMPGILGAWPVFSHVGTDQSAEVIDCCSESLEEDGDG